MEIVQAMRNKIKLNHDKIIIILLIVLPCLMLYKPVFENDTYWLLNTGNYIMQHGFPVEEPFTIHQGLSFSIQQWLSAVIFYLIYDKLGIAVFYLSATVLHILITYIIYRIAIIVSKNKAVSITIAVAASILLNFFIVLRPQIFSLAVFALEIYILESYIQSRKVIWLVWLPVLSIALINLHSAMWWFFFVMIIPYIIDSFHFNIRSFIRGEGYPKIPLNISIIVSFIAGLANPYGLTNMLYFFRSYGNDYVNNYIHEMRSPDFKTIPGIYVFIVYLIIIGLYLAVRNRDFKVRYILITLGTAYMGLSSIRSIPLFIVCAFSLAAYHIKSLDLLSITRIKFKNKYSKIHVVILRTIIAFLVIFIIYMQFTTDFSKSTKDFCPVKASDYIINNINTEKMRLYNEYNTGGYLEYRGIRTFQDSRAEVFLKSLNLKEDILIDAMNVEKGKSYYKDFIEKYNLTHFLIKKGALLDIYLSKDKGYERLYEDDDFVIYGKRAG